MNRYFNVGDRVSGFCNGYFGSSDYEDKICTFVAPMYAVFQYTSGSREGMATVLNNPDELDGKLIRDWKW